MHGDTGTAPSPRPASGTGEHPGRGERRRRCRGAEQDPGALGASLRTTLPSLLCCCFIICALECKRLPPPNLPLALPYSALRYFCFVVEAIKCRMRKRPVAASTSTRCTLKIDHVNGAEVLLPSVPNRTLCDLIMLLAAA